MAEHIIIPRRFNGPPESGHGGYVGGVVAGLVGGEAEITLRRPPPLDKPLEVQRLDGDVTLVEGDTVIAEGVPTSVEMEAPESVSLSDAEAASRSYMGLRQHAFPTCFGCGPERTEGDGLRIFPGRVEGREVVAAPWTPHSSLVGEDGIVAPEFVWAALDDSGAWSLFSEPNQGMPVVLGRMAARLIAPVSAGEGCVVVGWPLGEDGRKLYSGTALFSAAGELRAVARATWVRLA